MMLLYFVTCGGIASPFGRGFNVLAFRALLVVVELKSHSRPALGNQRFGVFQRSFRTSLTQLTPVVKYWHDGSWESSLPSCWELFRAERRVEK